MSKYLFGCTNLPDTNKGYDEEALKILQKDLILHASGTCECSECMGQVHFCLAGAWHKGIIPSKHIIENYHNKVKGGEY